MVHSSLNAHWCIYYRTLWQSRFCISQVHLANKQALQAVIWATVGIVLPIHKLPVLLHGNLLTYRPRLLELRAGVPLPTLPPEKSPPADIYR